MSRQTEWDIEDAVRLAIILRDELKKDSNELKESKDGRIRCDLRTLDHRIALGENQKLRGIKNDLEAMLEHYLPTDSHSDERDRILSRVRKGRK